MSCRGPPARGAWRGKEREDRGSEVMRARPPPSQTAKKPHKFARPLRASTPMPPRACGACGAPAALKRPRNHQAVSLVEGD